jgi:tripartite-type tricarboxylate transporter receptor subunit TctC
MPGRRAPDKLRAHRRPAMAGRCRATNLPRRKHCRADDAAPPHVGYAGGGQERQLAVTSAQRNAMLPEVPAMREAGLPGYEVGGWYGLHGPTKLAPGVADRLANATRRVLATADFLARLAALGYQPWNGSAETLATQAVRERAKWGGVIKGIEIE